MKLSSALKIATILILISFGLYYIPNKIPLNNLKPHIIKRFSDDDNLNLKIFGDVKISILPNPSIIINQARLDVTPSKQIEIPQLTIKLDPVSLIGAKIIPNNVLITSAQFDLASLESIADSMFNKKTSQSKPLQSFSFNNVNLVINPSAIDFNKVKKINGHLLYHVSKHLKFKGSYDLNGFVYALDVDLNPDAVATKKEASAVTLSNDFMKVAFKGNLTNLNDYNLDGKIVCNFFDKATTDPRISTINHAILQDNIEIKSSLKLSTSELILNNLHLSSNNISKFSGNLKYLIKDDRSLESTFEGKSINIDKIFAGINSKRQGTEEEFTLESFIKSFLIAFNFNMADDVRGKVDLKIKELIFNKEKILNIDVNSRLVAKEITLDKFILTLPGNNSLVLKGVLTHNDIRPKFDGSFDLNITNYKTFSTWLNFGTDIAYDWATKPITLKSDIIIIPRNMWLSNTSFTWDELKAFGRLDVKHTGEKSLSVLAEVHVNDFDANKVNMTKRFDNFITDLYAYDYDRGGTKFYEITDDFKWLRSFPVNLNLDLSIGNFKFKEINFPNFSFSADVSSNKFLITELLINSPEASLKGKASLITSSIAPKISTNLDIDYLTTNFLEQVMPQTSAMIAKQTEVAKINADATRDLTIGGINFYGLNNVIGDFQIRVKDFRPRDLTLQNLNLHAQSQDGLISISEFGVDMFGGRLESIANVAIYSLIPNYSATFAFNNFMLKGLLKYYADFDTFDGYMSINGNVAAKGADANTFYPSLTANVNLLGKKVIWNNYSIGEIIKLSEYQAPLIEKSDKLKLYNSSGQSLFDSMQGKIYVTHGMANLQDFTYQNERVSGAFAATLDVRNRLISIFNRMSFIPVNRAATISIDITGSGPINKLDAKVNYNDYFNFLKNDYSNSQSEDGGSNNLRPNSLLRNQVLQQYE